MNAPAIQPLLPGLSFTEDTTIVTSKGTRHQRFGSVKKACAALDDCDVKAIYQLWHSGRIKAYKLNPSRPNSHLKVDMATVWAHKEDQMPGLPVAGSDYLTTATGVRIKRYGTVRKACRMLDDCDDKTIHDLWKAGCLRAWKLFPERSNSHLHVDLLSVWEHKQRQLAGR